MSVRKLKKPLVIGSTFLLAVALVFALFPTNRTLAVTETFSTATSSTWQAPAGVTSVTVECWGAGGAGGGSSSNNAGGGGGGGGGAYAIVNDFAVTPGNNYSYTVGAGGTGADQLSGTAGAASSFNGTTCVGAGGAGGIVDGGAGGAGGTTGASTGDTTRAGGTGATGTAGGDGPGGGAGSSAGTTTAGNNGTGSTGGSAPDADAGAGGNGGTTGTQVNGFPGSSPGGGGGGALERQGGTTGVGGNGADGQIRLTYIADEEPPSPDPNFATVPNATTTNSIQMISTTATDATSTPVSYYFDAVTGDCGADIGGGGTDSGWQTSTTYYDGGLSANKCYAYQVTAKDAADNTTATSTASSTYTRAAIPGAMVYTDVSVTSLTLQNAENGNSASNPTTNFVVFATSTDSRWNGYYVTSGGGTSTSEVWLSDAQIDGLTLSNLEVSTTYSFTVVARNADLIKTATSTFSSTTTPPDTTAPTPNPPSFTSVPTNDAPNQLAMNSVTVTDNVTASPEYYFTSVTGSCGADFGTSGTDSGWQTSNTFTDTGLDVNQCYGYEITARDEVGNHSATSTASSTYTSANVPGALSFSSVAENSFTITNNENGNPTSNPATTFAVYATSSDVTWNNRYVDASGNPTASKTWLTDAQIDGLNITGLDFDTEYRFVVLARNQDGDETASSTLSATTTLPDTAAPTPNPPTYETAPTADSSSSISATSTTATDPTGPVSYYFTSVTGSCGADIGSGGTDSGWQTSRVYTDSGLQTNKCYAYTLTAKDGLDNTTATSGASAVYTLANTPGTLSFSSVTGSSFVINNNENGNPTSNPATTFAVFIQSTSPVDVSHDGQYVDASGNPSASEVWLTDAQIDGLSMTGLADNTQYSFEVVARNQDGIETASSSLSSTTTLDISAPTPNPPFFEVPPTGSGVSAITATSTTATDPTGPVSYYFTSVTGSCGADIGSGGTDSGWQTSRVYTDSGLQTNKCYAYTLTAKDGLDNTTSTSTASTTYSSAAVPGALAFSNVGPISFTITNDENGNPTSNPATTFAVFIQSTSPVDVSHDGQYVDASGNPSASEVWLTDAQIDGLTLTGLEGSTQYTLQVKARNGANQETSFGLTNNTTTGEVKQDRIRLQGVRLQNSRLR